MIILVSHDGQQLGPFTLDDLRGRVQAGQILSTDLAWVEGTPAWVPLYTILSANPNGVPPGLPGSFPPAGYVPYQRPSSGMAVASLILGVLSFACLSIFGGIPAIICGHAARARIRQFPAQYTGAGMALAGLILGYFSVAIIAFAIVAAIVVPSFARSGEQAKIRRAEAEIASLKTALSAYEIEAGSFPSMEEGLNALVHQPGNKPGWRGPYMQKIPQDPWGNSYVYVFPGHGGRHSMDLFSMGPDGLAGTDDDIGEGGAGILSEEEPPPESEKKHAF